MLPQAVTTGWCTELGTTLVFGFDSTIEGSAYFRYLCAYQSATESPHEPSSSPGWTRATRALSLWGAPRIHGELLKLGIEVAPSTVGKYLRQRRSPPSQTWRTLLTNHRKQMASMDFFTVPTATFRVLFVFIVLSHDRRRVMHFNVTDHPSEEWTAQQIREAFPWEAPK